jgi:hypothetical protein
MLSCSAGLFVRFQQSDFVSLYVHSIVLVLLLSLDASAKNLVQTFLYSVSKNLVCSLLLLIRSRLDLKCQRQAATLRFFSTT